MFTPLTQKEVKRIIALQFNILQKMLADNNIKIEITENALNFIAEIGFDPQFGALPIKRDLQKLVQNELAKSLLAGELSSSKSVSIDSDGTKIMFKNA